MPRVEVKFDGVSRGATRAAGETRAAIRGVGTEADRQTSRVSRFGSTIRSAIGAASMAAGTGLVALGGAVAFVGFRFDDLKQRAQIAFTTMLGSGKRATAFLDQLQKFAQKTPFQFDDLIVASQRLMAMGFSAKQVLPTLTAVGDAVAAMGGSPEVMNRVIIAFGQMQAKGRVAAEEFLQLTEAGIPAWKFLAEKIGTDVPTAMKLVERRAISSSVAIAAITQGIERDFGGMMEKQSHTFSGLLSNLKDTFSQVAGQAMRPFFNMAISGMERLVEVTSTPEFTAGVKRFSEELGVRTQRAARVTFDFLRRNWSSIKGFISGAWAVLKVGAAIFMGVARASNRAADALGGWRPTLMALAGAFIGLRLAMFAFFTMLRVQAILTATTMRAALISSGIGLILVAIGFAVGLIIAHWDKVKGVFLRVAHAIAETYRNVFNWLVKTALTVALKILEPFSHLPGRMGGWAQRAKRAVQDELDSLQEHSAKLGLATGDAWGKGFYRGALAWSVATAGAVTSTMAAGGLSGERGLGAGSTAPGGPAPKGAAAKVVSIAMTAARSPGAASTRFHLPGERTPYDCSAFTQAVFRNAGISIGSTTYSQVAGGRKVSRNDVQPGDLLLMHFKGAHQPSPSHVGIYVGGGRMVHDHGDRGGVEYQAVPWGSVVAIRCYISSHNHKGAPGGDRDGARGGTSTAVPAPSDALYGVGSGDLTGGGTGTGAGGSTKSTVIGLRGQIDAQLRNLPAGLSAAGRAAAQHLRDLRKSLHVGMSSADLARTRVSIQRWGKVLSTEIKKAKDAAAKAAREAAEDAQRALDRQFSHASRLLQRDFDRQTQQYVNAFQKETDQHVATMQKGLDGQLKGMRKSFEAQMRAFDAETERGLKGFEVGQTPAESALAQFQAARQAEQDAQALAEAAGDPERLRELELERQERALEEAARISREAADNATEEAQRNFRDQRDRQREALEEQEQALEDSLQERFNEEVTAYQAARDLQLQAWQDLRDDQQEQLNNDLEDWQRWLTEKKRKWVDFLRWINERGIKVPPGWLAGPADDAVERLFLAGSKAIPGSPQRAQHGGRVPGRFVGIEDTVLMRVSPGEEILDRSLGQDLRSFIASGGGGAGVRYGPIYVLGTTEREVARALANLTAPELDRRIGYRADR